MEICPFVYSRALKPAEFYNRTEELRRLLGRLVTGQSTALIGQPHIGKTSFLNYLLNPKSRQTIVGNKLNQSIFSYIDSQMLSSSFDQPTFWKQALIPLLQEFPSGEVYKAYQTLEHSLFGTFALEQFFRSLGQRGWQFILFIDEFDALLTHPILNEIEFYGGLRSLTSRCEGFALVIASRRSLHVLNQETHQINPHGSPYFNVFTELRLGPLPEKHVKVLIGQAKGRFGSMDWKFILQVSGRHPYLLQIAAAALWYLHEQKKQGIERYYMASEEVYRQTYAHYADTWNAWSNAERKAFTAIALAQIQGMVDNHTFSWKDLIENITDYSTELRRLKDSGTIVEIDNTTWKVTQQAFLWWLADEIKRISRDRSDFKHWLCEQEMDGLLTKRESRQMGEAVKKVSRFIGKGATTLIEAFAEGLGASAGRAFGA